jgi:hypothetical protein
MFAETKMLFAHIIKNDLPLTEILKADYTFINERLANLYGIPGVSGAQFRKVPLSGTKRRGFLTQASFLTANAYPTESHIIKRGKAVLAKITCNQPPGLPMNNGIPIPELTGNTPREKLEAHRADPQCAGCHKYMDPIGFGLEQFDLIGRYRTNYQNGFPVDSNGAFPDGRSFEDSEGLVALLAEDDNVNSCASKKLLSYALGRTIAELDVCTIDELASQLRQGKSFSELVVGVVNSVPFRQQPGEAL